MSFLVATVRRRKQNSILRATDTSCLRFESTRQNIDECIDISAKKKAYIDRGHLEISMYSLLYVRDILNLFDSYDLVTTTYGKRSTKSSMIDYLFYEDETNVKNINSRNE
ncbi:hypothetical protein HZU73_00489 [Apis mellifera caucasica]|nr:hypothetical protein HZU73_00489 [Apis mellifera caucasica]KAG9433656.1 hypothetical protein HZU67_04206 [Apis mellifera carnica]